MIHIPLKAFELLLDVAREMYDHAKDSHWLHGQKWLEVFRWADNLIKRIKEANGWDDT